jgi:cytidylate kinase
MIIAIDGPSGAGKSTLGKRLASAFDLIYLDTGAMYRAVGLAVVRAGIDLDNSEAISELAKTSKIELKGVGENRRIFLDREDVTQIIRNNKISHLASLVSAIPGVRDNLVARQQEIGRSAPHGAVLDGRDIGTVVFPDADFKFFLTADPEHRAERRYREDIERGRETTYKKTLEEIIERDERDATREHSPLRKADDAIVIDTSSLNIEEVFEKMSSFIK